MKFCVTLGSASGAANSGEGGSICASDQNILWAVLGTEHGFGDIRDLLRRFALGEYDFSVALP
jgi:hypothetical protein